MADYAVGAQVEVELSLPGGSETASGTVFAYDAASDRLVLRQPGSTPFHSTLRLLKGADVARVTQLKAAPPGGATPLPAVDLGRCREREEKAAIFDALAKTLPCRWDGDRIVVLDEIVVPPPYDTCISLHNDDAAALRVKKVLDAERQRLQAG
ncbi:Anticodon-binding domain [Micractinium conductrix]|uniref:Anticodon-binding domain n=1 Tax=Micractinium conductrix TaxID=554055 RepID=A0A2P6UYW0_9CHLO|nr:Anticodon-binding domain [Micractinium conductrix]|eukprot:PSC67016.1 Anticodon-binding domain [Micractinium conductrix]